MFSPKVCKPTVHFFSSMTSFLLAHYDLISKTPSEKIYEKLRFIVEMLNAEEEQLIPGALQSLKPLLQSIYCIFDKKFRTFYSDVRWDLVRIWREFSWRYLRWGNQSWPYVAEQRLVVLMIWRIWWFRIWKIHPILTTPFKNFLKNIKAQITCGEMGFPSPVCPV